MTYDCSVVVIARNAGNTIKECIDSLKDQSLSPLEVIVVDNGSTDLTPKIALDSSVIVVSEPVIGRGKARNRGVLSARGSMVAFIDSDAVADKDWLKYLADHGTDEKLAGVASNICASNRDRLIPRMIDLILRDKPQHATTGILYRKNSLLEVGLFNGELRNAEDVEIAWRIIRREYKIEFEPKAIVYHKHPEALRKFLYQQYDFGRWSYIARKLSGEPTSKSKLLIFFWPLTFFKHLTKIKKHPLLPFLLTASSMAYAVGTLRGALTIGMKAERKVTT